MVVAVIGGDARVVFGGYCHGFGRKGFICKKKKSYNLWQFLTATNCDLIFFQKSFCNLWWFLTP